MKKIFLLTGLFLGAFALSSSAQTSIAAKDAAKHLNEKVTICDQVFGGKFLASPGITLIDLGGAHPNEALTIFIKGDDRKKFKTPPEEKFKGKKVCVIGTVIDYKGKPEIIVTDTTQIKLQ